MQVFRVSNLVPGPIKAQIGDICVYWAVMELTVERLIWHLSGIGPKQGRALTAKENIDPRLKRLKTLANQKLSCAEEAQIHKICSGIKQLKKKRNWVVHGLYGVNAQGDLHALYYRDDPIKGEALRMNLETFRAIRSEIFDAQKKLERFLPLS